VLIVGLVGAVSAVALSLMPNQYAAVALVHIEPRDKKIAPIDSVIPGLKGDTVTIESEVETLRSRTLLLKVIDKLGLRSDPEYVGPTEMQKLFVNLGLARAPAQPPAATPAQAAPLGGQPRPDWVLAIVQSKLRVGRVRNTLVMSIEYTSTSPAKAMRIANAIADTYIEAQLEAKQEAQRRATAMLSERVATLAEKLARSEQRLTRFMADNDIYITEGHELLERQLTREMEETVKAQANVSQVRARYQKVQQMMRDGADIESISDVLNSQTIRQLRNALSKSERRMAEAKARLGPKHPTMAQIRADHALARQALKLEAAKIIANLRQERDIAESRETNLAKEEIKQSKKQQVKLRELTRDVEATRQLYEALLSRSKQTAATAGLHTPIHASSSTPEFRLAPPGRSARRCLQSSF
jgi:succinoglycan biosynthesis transport protein ExoP